jgi:hypothetical protein
MKRGKGGNGRPARKVTAEVVEGRDPSDSEHDPANVR